ncbi:MAG: serine/threonine-protein phosphatase [Candidatus Solibacter usitatus]|nr:serine/threonine-protein phosphatase [Candidatus Solibacter usitatus]
MSLFSHHRVLAISLLLYAFAVCAANAQYVDLSGDWRISKDDNPRYAEPAFDDSAWGTVKLPWEIERPLGVYWLRKSVPTPSATQALALAIGSVNESYELFVNGSRIAATPGFGTTNPPFFEPRATLLPDSRAVYIVVALRIFRPMNWIWVLPNTGNDFGPYAITVANHAPSLVQEAEMRRARRVSWNVILALFLLFASFYLFWTFRKAREWREVFWLGVFCSASCGSAAITPMLGSGPVTSYASVATLYNLAVAIISISLAEFLMAALRINVRLWRWIIWLTLPLSVGRYWLPIPLSPAILPALLCVFLGARALGGEREMRPTVLLTLAFTVVRLNAIWENGMGASLFPTALVVGQIRIPIAAILGMSIATMLMFVTLGRLLRDKGEKQRMTGEMQAAREIQQLMLSNATKQTGEYNVDAVYHPAQEVGGDFYRIVDDGDAKLVVVGDVSGKGLKAAMLVSVIIGALRVVKDRTPAAVLATLSNAVAGQLDGGFVTCCCARLEPGGTVRLANAEQLTFLSDGVVEAAGRSGELFGFDRTREISMQSAVRIADAAKAWGQNDDITVVTIQRRA